MNTRTKQTYIYTYFAILLLILLSWTNVHSAPSEIIRLLFLIAVVAPAFFDKLSWMPASLICFYTISQYGYAYSYMPTTLYYYMLLLLVALLFSVSQRRGTISVKVPVPLVCLAMLVFVVDYLTSGVITNSLFSIVIISLLALFIQKNDSQALFRIELAFVIMSLALSVMYITMRKHFIIDTYLGYYGMDRGGWTDLNYFGMIMGFGSIVSLFNLLNKPVHSKVERIIYIANLVVVFPALVLAASRGALLSTILGYAYIVLRTNAAKKYKLLFICLSAIMVIYLYNNDYFALIEYRIQADDGSGSGRTRIWQNKLHAFLNEGTPLNYLFGVGYNRGVSLGTSRTLGFHNDYLAVLVEYGLVGLVLFGSTFISLVRGAGDYNKTKVTAVAVYLFLCCLTLEPFTLGLLPFWLILLYLTVLSKQKTGFIYE